jgi:hypothetical protein
MGNSDSSTPTFVDYGGPAGAREAYPAWSTERHIPLSKEEIEDIFLDLTQKFGFQRDSMRNMVSVLPIPYLITRAVTRCGPEVGHSGRDVQNWCWTGGIWFMLSLGGFFSAFSHTPPLGT